MVDRPRHARRDSADRIKEDLERRVETLMTAVRQVLDGDEDGNLGHDTARVLKAVDENFGKKRLFVCCDGTWKNASGTIEPLTNVARLARCVARVGHVEPGIQYTTSVNQVTYYSPGVGSQSALAIDSGFSGATGKGVTASILNAYCFLCNNYNFLSQKDEIILVGYSRGAFTVRCLAALVSDVGLIRRKNLPFLRVIFKRWLVSQERRRAVKDMIAALNEEDELFSHMADIKVLAEWDTVSAMGIPFSPWKSSLSFVEDEVPPAVKNAFFALALDEKRWSFRPMPWKRCQPGTTVRQCAFTGCHADIGGGNPDAGLSTISLLWMIAQIQDVTSAKFDLEALLQFFIVFLSTPWKKDQDVGQVSWRKSSQYVKNLSVSKGNVHQTLSGVWAILHYLSLGRYSGRRNKHLEAYKVRNPSWIPAQNRACSLEIHFSVATLLGHNPVGPLAGSQFGTYEPHGDGPQRAGWQFMDGWLFQARISKLEAVLLREWQKEADRVARSGGDLDTLDYWENVIKRVVGPYETPNDRQAVVHCLCDNPWLQSIEEEG